MTPKECFEKWDAQYVTYVGADYRQMIEDIESTNEAHDIVVVGEFDLVIAIACASLVLSMSSINSSRRS